MTKTFTVVVHEAEEGGYWGWCAELDCGSQGEDLDEMDRNIRESIESILEDMIRDGEDVESIEKAETVEIGAGDRKWEIQIDLPVAAAA